MLPAAQQQALDAALHSLTKIPEIAALVLGGSHARGFAHPGSDLDLGLYYHPDRPLSIEAVRATAEALATPGTTPVVTGLYGWGPWVNGGAWIQTPATKIDFVYRNLQQVETVLAEGRQGVWRHDFDQQPPFGFRSVVYFAETHFCIPLHDPHGVIAALKAPLAQYPPALKATILRDGLWSAEFSLWSATGYAASADVLNATGCLTRAAHYLTHALFALNEEYFLNDKHVARLLPGFALCPPDTVARLAALLGHPGHDAASLRASLDALRQLWAETVALTAGAYQPRFDLAAALRI